MKEKLPHKWNLQTALIGAVIVVLAISLVGAYRYWVLTTTLAKSEESNIDLVLELEQKNAENASLLEVSREQKAIIDSFGGQIENIKGAVGTLEKLSQTDEELLKKYSKVYFLNENYIPSELAEIDKRYVLGGSTNFMVHADVWPYLEDMLQEAREDGIDLLVASAYRSFTTQASLKSEYKVLYGSGANQFSADQGYSEHQLGTALDLTTPKVGGIFNAFETDPAYKWLNDNAYKYGFILSYPKGNTYYKFEPWHWRFVGTSLAKYLHNENKRFYDIEQREIDAYLINIFD